MRVPDDDKLFSGLDAQQAAIVRHVDGPALVVAGAGAGKTTTLVRRTAHLIRTGVNPSSILLLTFTRAAAKSILDRARAYAPEADRVQGGTFHSVAARVIREHHEMFALPSNFTVADPGDVEDMIKRILAEEPLQGSSPRASTIAKILSFSINTRIPIPTVIRDKYTKWDDFAPDIERLSGRLVEYKKKNAILDFDDLLVFFEAMAKHEAAGELLRRRFRHVMVDEVQDCNALQVGICHGLGAGDGNIMAVGDPSQSIYAFRGSAPAVMFSFRKHWPSLKTYLIETNYRSTPEIVAAADRVDRSMANRFERVLVAKRASQGVRPSVVSVDDRSAEAAYVADAIVDRRDEGVPFSEQAVLVRSMRHIRHVEVELAARGIATVVRGGIRIHEAQHVKDALSPLRIVHNLNDEPAWIRLLTQFPKIGEKTALAVCREARESGTLEGALAALEALSKKRPTLSDVPLVLKAAAASDMPGVALSTVRAVLEPTMSNRYDDEWEWRRKDIDALVDIAGSHPNVEEFLRTLTIDVSIDKHAEYVGAPPESEGSVTLATIHSAKGLEWTVVFVPSFVEGHLPSAFVEGPEDEDEERRLMYVAVTRAKRDLVFVRPRTTMVKGQPAFVGPSPYEALIKDHLDQIRQRPYEAPSYAPGAGRGILISVR